MESNDANNGVVFNCTNHGSNNDSDSSNSNDGRTKRLKKMGWYWGSISPEFASKLLENEQDGTFLIRDSSSECYIFSMTVKLSGQIHHVRIDHCKGQFSFGRSRKFICKTIIDFIEQAMEYSHNGELLFFLHRDPGLDGPVRLFMNPLSRLRNKTSLKHLTRSAILPYMRRDKIDELSLPDSLKSYLFEPFQPMVES